MKDAALIPHLIAIWVYASAFAGVLACAFFAAANPRNQHPRQRQSSRFVERDGAGVFDHHERLSNDA